MARKATALQLPGLMWHGRRAWTTAEGLGSQRSRKNQPKRRRKEECCFTRICWIHGDLTSQTVYTSGQNQVSTPSHWPVTPPKLPHQKLPSAPGSVLQYGVEEYISDSTSFGVTKSVHVQANFDGQPVAETKWLQEIADKHGFPNAIVAYADLSSANVGDVLKEHCKYANIRGIRQMLDYHSVVKKWCLAPHDNFLTDNAWLTGLKLMEEHGLSFDLQVHVPQMQRASTVARSHPSLQFIVTHAGMPADLSDEALANWKAGIAMLARHDNVAIKLSGFSMFHHDWTKELLAPLVDYVINVFTVDRCMFASNFPVDKVNAPSYSQMMGTYLDICADMGLSQDEVNKMFRDNAARLYRI